MRSGGVTMPANNLHVQTMTAHNKAQWDEGYLAGYDDVTNPLPAWYFTVFASHWSSWQRGYWFGREHRMMEIRNEV